MRRYKYIRFASNSMVIFPPFINHDAMASLVERESGLEPLSAGFLDIVEDGEIGCVGESTSLRLKSQPEDTHHLRAIL